MYSHAPADYDCLICRGVRGESGPPTLIHEGDVVTRNDMVVAAVCSFFHPRNAGHVIVVPTAHHENLYVMPPGYLHACIDMAKTVALAMKRQYGCDGITLRQNNEPAGSQSAFHFHLHVYPRYDGDGYDQGQEEFLAELGERAKRARRLAADEGLSGPR